MYTYRNGRRFRRRTASAVTAGLLSLSLVACGGVSSNTSASPEQLDLEPLDVTEEQQQYIEGLYEDALEEDGTVTVYGSVISHLDPLFTAFEERFPDITVEPVVLRGAELDARLQSERDTGDHLVDIIETPQPSGRTEFYEAYVPELFTLPEVSNDVLANDLASKDDKWFAPYINVSAPVINTGTMSPEDVPASWSDLASETWQGKIVASDPTQPSSLQGDLLQLLAAGIIDEAWLREFESNIGLVVGSTPLIQEEIASDAFSLGLSGISVPISVETNRGSPITVQPFSEGNTYATDAWGLAQNAPSPAGAKLLLEFVYSAEAQQVFSDFNGVPLSDMGDFEAINVVPEYEVDALREEYSDLLSEVFRGGARG